MADDGNTTVSCPYGIGDNLRASTGDVLQGLVYVIETGRVFEVASELGSETGLALVPSSSGPVRIHVRLGESFVDRHRDVAGSGNLRCCVDRPSKG